MTDSQLKGEVWISILNGYARNLSHLSHILFRL